MPILKTNLTYCINVFHIENASKCICACDHLYNYDQPKINVIRLLGCPIYPLAHIVRKWVNGLFNLSVHIERQLKNLILNQVVRV